MSRTVHRNTPFHLHLLVALSIDKSSDDSTDGRMKESQSHDTCVGYRVVKGVRMQPRSAGCSDLGRIDHSFRPTDNLAL